MSLTADQIETRKRGVGCSELLAALGKDSRCSRLELFKRKRGELPDLDFEGDERVLFGQLLEPVIRQEFGRRIGHEIIVPPETLHHPSAPLVGHPDGWIDALNHGFEFKNRDWLIFQDEYGEDDTDQVPLRDLVQCVGYMELTGAERWMMGVLVGGNELHRFVIRRDDELVGAILAGVAEFWQHVESGVPPAPMTPEDVKLRWPKHLQPSVVATPEIASVVEYHAEVKAQLKGTEREEAEAKAQIQTFMAEAGDLVDEAGKTLATWRSAKPSQKFDEKRFREDHPDLHAEYCDEQPGSRRFLNKLTKRYETS